jgi:hypothetical protein
MYKRPILTDTFCKDFSDGTGMQLSNRNWKGERWPILKTGEGRLLDTSYTSKEYADIAKKFSGDVLILGLGFGKAVIDACANPKVKSVTVIENNEHITELFALMYHRQFKGSDKLSIKEMDAMEYKTTKYNHVFIDIFHLPMSKNVYLEQTQILRNRFSKSKIYQIRL